MRKRVILLLLAAIVLVGGFFAFVTKANQKSMPAQANTSCETHDTVIEMLLFSEIQKDVDAYYKPYFNTQLNLSPVFMTVLDIERAPSGYDVSLQVSPYLGAHNAVGEDTVRINVTTDRIATKEFKHTESYDVPDFLKQYVIKWPPQQPE